MTADAVWPNFLKSRAGKAKVTASTISGGRSIAGIEQIVANDAGFWRLTMAGIRIRGNDQVRYWNYLEAILQGKSGTIIVPMLDCLRSPYPPAPGGGGGVLASYGHIPYSDGALHSDGTGFYQPVIVSEISGDISQRATTAQILMTFGGELLPGHHFSVGERGYRVTRVTSAVTTAEGTLYTVTFWPPAREPIADGAGINFDEPVFRARLATDFEMDFDPDLQKFGNPTLNFVEDV